MTVGRGPQRHAELAGTSRADTQVRHGAAATLDPGAQGSTELQLGQAHGSWRTAGQGTHGGDAGGGERERLTSTEQQTRSSLRLGTHVSHLGLSHPWNLTN